MTERMRGWRGAPTGRGGPRFAAAGLVLAVLAGTAAAETRTPGGGLGERFDLYPDLYTVRIAERNQGALTPALARAMRQMLARVTGLRRPEESPGVGEVLASPEGFVQQYHFESGPASGLTVKFDEEAVARLVERLGLGWWSRVRPLMLVWLVIEDEQGLKSYADSASPAAEALRTAADERGTPFLLPLFDVEDRVALPVPTLWGGFPEAIRRASDRYAPDAILVGRAYRGGVGQWQARWTLFAEVDDEFRTEGDALQTMAAEGLHEAADRLAARFARRGAAGAAVRTPIVVSGVEALEDYGRVLRYLDAIDVVEEVQVTRVEPSRVRLGLRVRGGQPALAELIALGRTLTPEAEGTHAGAGGSGDGNDDGEAGGRSGEGPAGGAAPPAVRYRLQ